MTQGSSDGTEAAGVDPNTGRPDPDKDPGKPNPYATNQAYPGGTVPSQQLKASWPAWLPPTTFLAALRHAGILFGFTVIVGILQAVFIFASGAEDILPGGTDLGWQVFQGGALVNALTYGGYLVMSMTSGGGFGISLEASVGLHFFAIALTLLAFFATVAWGLWEGRHQKITSRAHTHVVSAATAVFFTILMVVWVAIFHLTSDQVTLSGLSIMFVVGTLVVTYLGTWYGRTLGRARAPFWATIAVARDKLQKLWFGLREVILITVWGGIAYIVFAFILVIVAATVNGSGLQVFGSTLLWVGNIAVMVAAVTHLGAIDVSGSVPVLGSGSESISLWHNVSGWAWLSILFTLLVVVFIAVRIGLQRDPAGLNRFQWSWVLPASALVLWFLVPMLFVGLGVTISAIGLAGGAIYVALWVAPVMALWAAVVEFGARLLPRLFLHSTSEFIRFLGGRYTHPTWLGAQPEPGADGAQAGQAAPVSIQPMSRGAKMGLLIGTASVVAIALVVTGGVVALNLFGAKYSPESVVAEYANAIAAGDAKRASSLVDPNVPTAERVLLTNKALKGATERISNVSVKDLGSDSPKLDFTLESGSRSNKSDSKAGENRFVELTYSLDGVKVTRDIALKKGKKTGLFDNWEVVTPLLFPVELTANMELEGTFGNQQVELTTRQDDSGHGLWAYPGVYPLKAEKQKFVTAESASVKVGATKGNVLDYTRGAVTAKATSELTDAVQKLVNEKVNSCISGASTTSLDLPDSCPFSLYFGWAINVQKAKFTVDQQPAVEVEPNDGYYDSDADFIFQSNERGKISVKYQKRNFSDKWEKANDHDDFGVRGKVVIDGDDVSITLEQSY